MGQGFQAYLLNMRRPIFQDRRVREALDYTYDFEKINLYNMRDPGVQHVLELGLRGEGLAGPRRARKLLEPFRDKLPPEVFGPPYVPPRTDTSPNALRDNLKKARTLLEEAGWKVDARRRACATRRASRSRSSTSIRRRIRPSSATSIWQRNLAKVGITLKVR